MKAKRVLGFGALLLSGIIMAGLVFAAKNTCSDTDGGNSPLIFGTVSGKYNNQPYSYSDVCIDSSIIKEYYCSGLLSTYQQQSCGTDGYVGNYFCQNDDTYRNYTDYSCASGQCGSTVTPTFQKDCNPGYCSNGNCRYTPSCSDSDGGQVFETQGTVSGYTMYAPYSWTDACVNGTMLNEFYCNASNSYVGMNTTCAGSCVSGACV
jgi:hypothetical protein